MTHEQIILSLIGMTITLMLGVGGIIRWAIGRVDEKIGYVMKRFDSNTERVMDKFEGITNRMSESFMANEKDHHKIGEEIILLKNEIDRCHASCPMKGGNGW